MAEAFLVMINSVAIYRGEWGLTEGGGEANTCMLGRVILPASEGRESGGDGGVLWVGRGMGW